MRARLTPSQRVATAILASILAFPIGATPPTVQATSGGSPYDIPTVIDTNLDPNIVETTITADETTVSIGGGVTAHAFTFNGTIPGPEFRLKVGDRVIVHFHNALAEPTGIHWHGIELQNLSDGTPLTQNQVQPGGDYIYDWVARRPGVYWYHPHHEFSTNQVFKGLYGSIIVTDPNEAALITAGRLPSLADTRTLSLSDITVCKAAGGNDAFTYDPGETDSTFDPPAVFTWLGGPALLEQQAPNPTKLCDTPIDNHGAALGGALGAGDVPNIQSTSGRVNEGQTVLTNGVNVGGRAGTPSAPGALDAGASALDVHPGQGLRLRIGNAATTRFFHLHLRDGSGASAPLYRVGGEGGLLDNVELDGTPAGGFDFDYNEGEILLDPGDRADVVIAFPASASGIWTLWTEDFRRTGNGDSAGGWTRTPTVPVAHFNVTGGAVPAFTISDGAPLRSSILGAAVEALPAATGHLLDPSLFPTPQAGMPLEDIQITVSPPSINGIVGTHDFTVDYTLQEHMDSNRWAFIGDVLELTVTNTSPADHPFHLHGFSIQPLTFTSCETFGGAAQPTYTFPHEFMDNIDMPGKCTLTFRVRLDDRPFPNGTPGAGVGRWMFHCHIFFHHHQGMVSELTVVKPDVAITSVAAPALVYAVGTNVTVTTSSLGLLVPTYNWDDNGVTTVGTPTGGANFTSSHTFTQAGVYTVTATVTRNGFSDSDSVMLVVYDPSAGFVTGGGTIASGVGAYQADLTLTGTASFGFVSKYQKGANAPTGQTEFNFQVASFNFHSTAYEWLVVAGAKAQYKGIGTINGTGHYGFLLSAVDGDVNGGGGTDKFRIKIWNMDAGGALVYDNKKGESDDVDNANPQALRSGNIVIHSGK